VDGFLVEVGDVEGLAERLARLAADPELRHRLGEAARARVHARYAVDRLVDDVDRLYRALLEARPTRLGPRAVPALRSRRVLHPRSHATSSGAPVSGRRATRSEPT
jgi:hypothetical protein